MKEELRAKMNNLCFQMTELSKELRLDPSTDAQFCARQVASALSRIEQETTNQWGHVLGRLQPVELVATVEEETFVTIADASDAVASFSVSSGITLPKAKKK